MASSWRDMLLMLVMVVSNWSMMPGSRLLVMLLSVVVVCLSWVVMFWMLSRVVWICVLVVIWLSELIRLSVCAMVVLSVGMMSASVPRSPVSMVDGMVSPAVWCVVALPSVMLMHLPPIRLSSARMAVVPCGRRMSSLMLMVTVNGVSDVKS